MPSLDDPARDVIFRRARTRRSWSAREVPEALIRDVYDLMKWGPTANNTSPARFVWVSSPAAKQTLHDLANGNNKARVLAAPVTVIIGYDLAYAEKMPLLALKDGEAARDRMRALPDEAKRTIALRNSSLQGAYLMIAARALGLDCGPMSGFDAAGVDAAFFAGTSIKSNFICSIGYGDDEPRPRAPRLAFEDACRIV